MILHAFYFVCHSFDSFTLNFNNISFAQVWRITIVLLSLTLSTQPPLGEVMTHNILHSLRSSFISYLSLYYWSISKRTIYHPSSIRWFHINKGYSFASVANQDVDILNVLVWMISHNVDVDDLLVKIVLINGYYWGYFWHLVFEKQALLMKKRTMGAMYSIQPSAMLLPFHKRIQTYMKAIRHKSRPDLMMAKDTLTLKRSKTGLC